MDTVLLAINLSLNLAALALLVEALLGHQQVVLWAGIGLVAGAALGGEASAATGLVWWLGCLVVSAVVVVWR
jgi:hypothetical protein